MTSICDELLKHPHFRRMVEEYDPEAWYPPSPWHRIETDGPPPQRAAVLLAYAGPDAKRSVLHGYLDGDGQYILVGGWRAYEAFQHPVAWLSLDDLPPVPVEWLR